MKTIEEEIKQKQFPNIYVKIGCEFVVYLLVGCKMQSDSFVQEVRSYLMQQYNVLSAFLRGQHPKAVMLTQITERMIDKMSNATRLVEKLKLKDLVTRELNAQSRRQVDINITEKGLALLKQIDEEMDAQNPPAHYTNLTIPELELLNSILDKIRN
jgi:DNA-binding MarR family transcriptional regulator